MEKQIAKDLDRILNYLDGKNGQLFEILDELGIDKKNKELLLKELESKGLVRANRSNTGNHYIMIEPEGKAFIQSGQSFLKLRTSSINQSRELMAHKIVNVIGVLFSCILGCCSYNQNDSIKDLNKEIKVLNNKIEVLERK
jgi:DNA-binding MarR family transcriptional regulator